MPEYEIDINNLQIINSCSEFYNEIIENLEKSESAYIITLYLGTKEYSKNIFKALKKRKERNLKTKIFVDKNRIDEENSKRYLYKYYNEKSHDGYTNKEKTIYELLEEYEIASMIQYVDLKNYYFLPKILRELFYVLHSKIYVFDNRVFLTGANLDDSYFVNRVDRYYKVESNELSAYLCFEYFKVNQTFYIREESKKNIKSNKKYGLTYKLSVYHSEIEMLKYLILENSFKEYYLSTAYINFPEEYIQLFKNINLKVIVPDSRNNTFFNENSTIERIIVDLYSIYLHDTIDILKNRNGSIFDYYIGNHKKSKAEKKSAVKFYKYYKKNNTFHYKGFWAFKKDCAATIIGSTNFNRRSYSRDKESNFLLFTKDKKMIKVLRAEVDKLFKNTKEIKNNTLDINHKISKRILAMFLKSFM
ncbi:Phospholipase D [Spraguea lophii 42_110]|uniref:CDP-diacylglycerol--glycerol-3-phosphate 3-phosphatidyltransferase n=1 Tax=Spraguea lophii (strain 42_110) TaxID=1358809 RepID=S7XUN7_SPRLO|nr:Phospholipase D [Spraguea lophii 42_110]